MLEKQIEEKCGDYAKSKGLLHLKFTSPNHAAVPDRLVLANIPLFLRTIISQYVRFVEYKREGQKPTPAQEREHTRLRAMGFTVEVVDCVDNGKLIIEEMG